ncbi:MAG: hypothetical protein ACRDUY_01535 [Nitriliruptorales bacterium]
MVEREDIGGVVPLAQDEDGHVGRAKREIALAAGGFVCARHVRGRERRKEGRATRHLLQQGKFAIDASPGQQEVVDLREDER